MTLLIGLRELDDVHLRLIQACNLVVEGMRFRPALLPAIADLAEILEEHNTLEGSLLRFLPKEDALEHSRIHDRALALVISYTLEEPSSCYPRLHRILTMIRAHHGSLEEIQLMDALKAALKEGRLISRT